MRFVLSPLLALAIFYGSPTAHAGKVDDVKAAMKKFCSREVENNEALRLVKSLYLTCVSGQKVNINGCLMECLKENTGAVVGK